MKKFLSEYPELISEWHPIKNGELKPEDFTFGTAESYPRIKLAASNVIEIISVIDSDDNIWYEVPYLAQDTTYIDVENTAANDPSLVQYNDTVPYLLKLKKTPRRYVTYITHNGKTELRFGSGISDSPDEEIIPNPSNVGSNLPGTPSFLDTAFDPANFLNTETYGQCPTNTTLTIKYSYGGSIGDNVASNKIQNITNIENQTFNIEFSMIRSNYLKKTEQDFVLTSGQN